MIALASSVGTPLVRWRTAPVAPLWCHMAVGRIQRLLPSLLSLGSRVPNVIASLATGC